MAFVSAEGARKVYGSDERPAWPYSLDVDSQPIIASPDGNTRIVRYRLKLGVPGIRAVEAGIRSNVFRNLGVKAVSLDSRQRQGRS